MSIARATEISATATESFDNAVECGIEHASKTLRNLEGAWIKDSNVKVMDGKVSEFRVNMEITFLLED